MHTRDTCEIIAYLALALAADFLIIHFTPPGPAISLPMQTLPGLVFGLGLFLAFRVAKRSHLRAIRQQGGGLFCNHCDFNLAATPDHCPECGRSNSGRRVPPTPPRTRLAETISTFISLTVVALFIAVAIMMHSLAASSGH